MLEALKTHTETHAPPQTRLTFRKLSFHAQPYLMPRDTVANTAATKVHSPSLMPHALLLHADLRKPTGLPWRLFGKAQPRQGPMNGAMRSMEGTRQGGPQHAGCTSALIEDRKVLHTSHACIRLGQECTLYPSARIKHLMWACRS